jgi:hypothetical protein
MSDDEMTCGRGLAAHAVIPAKIGEMIASLAENLELHMPSLVASDENTRREREAYGKLAAEHRAIAQQLAAVAAHMASYKTLPMGAHDEKALEDPKVMVAFGNFVRLQRELIAMLQTALAHDQELLA